MNVLQEGWTRPKDTYNDLVMSLHLWMGDVLQCSTIGADQIDLNEVKNN